MSHFAVCDGPAPSELSASNKQIPLLYTALGRSGQGCPLLRASDEHSFIVRVLRARKAPGRSFPFPPSSLVYLSKWVAWIGPQLRTSNDHSFIVGVP
jgi:hypothetical protein